MISCPGKVTNCKGKSKLACGIKLSTGNVDWTVLEKRLRLWTDFGFGQTFKLCPTDNEKNDFKQACK